MRSNHRVQVKNVAEMKNYNHGLPPLLMQNPYSKFILAIKRLSVDRFFKIFAGPIATNRDLDADKKILFLPSNSKKFSPKNKNLTSDFTH